VTTELGLGRSPEAIWVDLRAEEMSDRVCGESIHAAVFAGVLFMKATEASQRFHRPGRRWSQTRCEAKRPRFPSITARPAAINDQSKLGLWEGDQATEETNRSMMLWLIEQVTRYSISMSMPCGYAAEAVFAGLVCGLGQIPKHPLQSIILDQGSE